MRLKEIDAQVDEAEERLAALKATQKEATGRRRARCTSSVLGKGCGKMTEVRNLEYIQTHWYVSPYGCTGGDYWREGEGQFVCPKCGNKNRLYDRPDIEALKYHFGSITNVHDH